MAAPPNAAPLPPLDPNDAHFWTFTEPPLHAPFMPATTPNDNQAPGQNHDRSFEPDLPPAPPAPSPPNMPSPRQTTSTPSTTVPQGTTAAPPTSGEPDRERLSPDQERESEPDDASGSDNEDSDGGDDEEQPPATDWQPIAEDKSVPCEDELLYIAQKSEHSALDYAYWEQKIFFDLDDPEIYPAASGRIDWSIDAFNGTKEKPNAESVMRSPIFNIGGYDWRIKFYPKGNNSDYLSVYVECVTMQADAFEESKDFSPPPFPSLADLSKCTLRKSEAVQLGVVMYNPAEPRVYEYKADAHQFTKKSADYGWTRFTRYPRREFSFRMHGQRQAILRDDKLAFCAYIRVVHDPTHCMWSHGSDCYNDSITLTGLRPFSALTPMYSAKLALLHFAPFRDFIRKQKDVKIGYWLQCLLWKMLSRKRSENYGSPINGGASIVCDAVAWLRHVAMELRRDTDPAAIKELMGSLDPSQGAAVGANRLKTKHNSSIQSAVDNHPTLIATPALLTLELERAEFDRKDRKWRKIVNKVDMQNRIIVHGTRYVLYAFSTHCGDLTSNKFNFYVRPNGLGALWYAYTDGNVRAMTHKQAVDAHRGLDISGSLKDARHTSSRHRRHFRFDDVSEVAQVIYYVRDDYRHHLIKPRVTEHWDFPENVMQCKPPKEIYDRAEPPQTALGPGEMSAEMEQLLTVEVEAEAVRQSSSTAMSGAATPNAWIKDGEDIVMDDAEAVSTGEEIPSPEFPITGCTIEHLGREYYKGSMLGNRYHGEGHLIYMNGDEYTGAFVAGEKSGFGKMVYARTGNVYEGHWFQDQHHGQGTLTEAKTKNVFEGGWKNGKKSGPFVLKGNVTDEDKGCCSICYEKDISTAFYDCGHVLACRECAYKIDQCPVCRRRVVGRLELFGVKMVFE